MRRARWKRKNVRRVGLRRRRPPAAGGGRLAVPRGGQGRKRAALGEPFGLGKLGIPSATLPAAAHASSKNSQRQRKKKQLNASTTPTQEHHPPRDGSCKLAEDLSVPEGQAKSEQAPIRRPPCARRAAAPECAQAAFSFGPCTARFLFRKTEKKMGGASWPDKPPWREPAPRGRCSAARITPGGVPQKQGPLPFIFPQTRTRTPSR